ncbi:splicing factor 3A subunit 1 [Tremella mesenterica]|uniref:Splicing factor 3A subunit 1 n=1 Tax=Tremella mesenterica TaxID=5217 RepID=A0A4Q1BM77_TREME|nr:splicing factor 3A subunit 1 [Tremella mesenterica]
MATLNLPKPVKTYAEEDILRPKVNGTSSNGNGGGKGHDGEDGQDQEMEFRPPRPSDNLKAGIIYPPKEIRAIVDKTAAAVNKSPTPSQLEQKIRDLQKTDPKFSFLNTDDPYHQYYRFMREKLLEDAEDQARGIQVATPVTGKKEEKKEESAYEPRAWEFKVDLPGVTAMDLDILRLTALFHARRGRSFLSSLSMREGRNYQFDFLRPTHSLYGYYNRMVESYQKIMQPPPGLIERLVKESVDSEIKWKTLDEALNRAEWERSRRKRQDEETAKREEEVKAFAAIDWQDFVVVETIEFTQNDMSLELPPPTSVDKLRSMSMAEKRMASMVMEETGAGPTGPTGLIPPAQQALEIQMAEEEAEEVRLQRLKAEQEQARAREVQRAAMQQKGVKIKTDYVPKGIQRQTEVLMSKCPNCGQLIPENELTEHIRIELLDPKWKEQKRVLDMRKAQSQQMQQGTDVSASLRNLAQARTDLFGDEIDEAERRRREEEEKQKRREREKIIWDGHTNSAQKTESTFQDKFTLDEQIKQMHTRIGVVERTDNGPGPQIGPGVLSLPVKEVEKQQADLPIIPNRTNLPPALAASLPKIGGGTAYEGSTISAEPTGPTTKEYYEPIIPSNSPLAPTSSTTINPTSGPSIHPSRLAAMSTTSTQPHGQIRQREEDVSQQQQQFKRPRIEKLPMGQYYSEIDWMSLHPEPISLSIQLPNMPEKPEWKLNGSIITISDLSVSTLVSTLRERIKRTVDAELPISRLKLDYGGKTLNNASTLASFNLDEGDLVVMSVRKK